MNTRQKINAVLILLLIFLSFMSYHKTGSTGWLQYATLGVMFTFGLLFDVAFTDKTAFIFDPDADNWRRKTEAGAY
eukprot:CAMPEP_0204613674 /NCGR_PEP_ID=MMETSP0717-20131115/1600_1 /ASSEMBLY_ACC=CAM_ASM_000666 /TAXON_ID=230516 /ORGANISM="Chaetoceros curvisetus" /LENGTH=75 /DNA_ID=CAMNT_0051626165 /DNA_START=90 /DNA_END=317 /DNA_ORIENTATION=+